MSVSLTTITGPIYLPNGATPVGGRVSFELSSWDQEEGAGLVISGPVYTTIDSNGQFSVELYTSTAGVNSVHYRMFVIWEDSELSESYVNDIYVGTPTPHYTKKYIGSFALSGPGPFQVSDLNIISETNNSSFDAYLEMKAFADRIDLGVLDAAVQTTEDNAALTLEDRNAITLLAAEALDAKVASEAAAVQTAASAIEAALYGGYRVNAKFEKSLGIATDGSRVGITSEAVHIVPTSLLQIVNKQVSTGLRCSSYWTGTALTPFQNHDNSLWETYNKTVNNSLNLSWSISAPNAYNDIPAGVRDAGERVGVFGWATSVNIPGEYEHKGTLASQVGVKGRAGFQGDINLSPAGAVIESAVGVKGEVRGESPAAVIEKAYAGHFTSLDSSVTDVRDNVAIYAEASGGSISNYSFLGQAGKLHNRERVLFGDGSIVAAQSASVVSARATAPNALEFGNGDSSGYGCNIGATAPSGMPFIAFCAEAETSGNTFRTRGKKGMTISASFTGEMVFGQLTNANAGGQTITEKARFDSDGKLRLTETIVLRSATPSSATASGVQGEFRWDVDYLYICVAPNTWKRAAVATW